MKKIILSLRLALCTALFSALSSLLFSQGNLQFNQVLILDATTSGTAVNVPTGKVWKIESVAFTSNSGYFQMNWGGLNYFLLNNSSGYSNLPFWLPSGAAVSFVGSTNGKVSVIEFNVVP